jgi:hypothetical protein
MKRTHETAEPFQFSPAEPVVYGTELVTFRETVAQLQRTMSAGDSPMAGKGPFGRLRSGKA